MQSPDLESQFQLSAAARQLAILGADGSWHEADRFAIQPTDRGLWHGLGLFETILAIDGRPIFLDQHIERLSSGCRRLGWQLELGDLHRAIGDLLMRAGLASCRARVRLSMTGGSGSLLDRSSGSDRVIWMLASRIAADPDSISAEFATFPRNEKSPLVGLKCASYAENLLALDRAQRRGFDESLFFNTSGHLCEFATGNVFLVSNQRLLTPSLDTGCLPGVARAVVIRLASAAGMECSELHLRRADLDSADEVFLTSALRGPLAVKRIENREMPVQLITNQLRRQWKDAVFEQNAL